MEEAKPHLEDVTAEFVEEKECPFEEDLLEENPFKESFFDEIETIQTA